MEELAGLSEVAVNQEERYGSALAGNLPRVAYTVRGRGGEYLFRVAEVGGTPACRFLLGSHRPVWLEMRRMDESVALRLRRPFFFFYPRLDVKSPVGCPLGSVKKHFILLHDAYEIRDEHNRQLFSILRRRWEPWVYRVRQDGVEVAGIQKVLLDLVRDTSTTFDDYRISFPKGADLAAKTMLLSATFLFDLVHFE